MSNHRHHYLYEHSCEKCDFSYKYVHGEELICGGKPWRTPAVQKKHSEKFPDHIHYKCKLLEVFD